MKERRPESSVYMLYKVGRFLQIVGMIILPMAIAGQALDRFDQRMLFLYTGVGGLVFTIGWFLQEAGKK